MADEHPPILTEVPTSFKDRYASVQKKFEEKYGCQPSFLARAPGRVNLIGEHIDYCGYGVLPMAIEQDIVMAVRCQDNGQLNLANTDAKFGDFSCDLSTFEISSERPEWYTYMMCGIQGMKELLSLAPPIGMQVMVDGTVPHSAGLSSSSALVCCAALATMHANGHSRSKKEMADTCASCEKYIGTAGGGMDQAISFMAQSGTAKKIDFNPLRDQDVTLPDGVTFVISNCCLEKNKATSNEFNTRVVECRLATQIIAKNQSLEWREIKRLGDLQKHLNKSLKEMEQIVIATLHEEVYSKQEVCSLLEVTEERLASTSLTANTLNVESFNLRARALHVYSEARRVEEFFDTCKTGGADTVQKLGELMNDSHDSCTGQYECSCQDLDQLVDICRKHGAVGSRLTGAGWGGCAVSLVPSSELTQFLDKVKAEYYIPRGLKERVNEALFATRPGSGAAIYTLE